MPAQLQDDRGHDQDHDVVGGHERKGRGQDEQIQRHPGHAPVADLQHPEGGILEVAGMLDPVRDNRKGQDQKDDVQLAGDGNLDGFQRDIAGDPKPRDEKARQQRFPREQRLLRAPGAVAIPLAFRNAPCDEPSFQVVAEDDQNDRDRGRQQYHQHLSGDREQVNRSAGWQRPTQRRRE